MAKRSISKNMIIIALIFITSMSAGCTKSIDVELEPEIMLESDIQSIMGEFGATLLAGQAADVKYLEQEQIEEIYGITINMYEAVESRMPIDPEYCDEYIFIHASEGNIDAIVDLLKKRGQFLASEESKMTEEHITYAEKYQLYVRGDYAAFGVGMSAENAIEFFKTKFIDN